MGVSELRRLRQFEEESRKLKQLVADLSLAKVMLQDVLQKSFEANAAQAARWPSHRSVPCEHPACLRGVQTKPFRLVRQTQGKSAGRTAEEAHA